MKKSGAKLTAESRKLWQEMANLTRPKCGQCRAPHSCCSPEYCDMAKEYVENQDEPRIEVLETGHPTLRYMGENGCVCPPHLRPLCTLHVCSIESFGFDPRDLEFTKRYFDLRRQIERVELLREGSGR